MLSNYYDILQTNLFGIGGFNPLLLTCLLHDEETMMGLFHMCNKLYTNAFISRMLRYYYM